ncbi:hypothetical protein F66182_6741 [Fusarium sp. NRRL 66182]|nr:hypothetical protein F66182_6741 [Fusarium sp. NRRL 66182]
MSSTSAFVTTSSSTATPAVENPSSDKAVIIGLTVGMWLAHRQQKKQQKRDAESQVRMANMLSATNAQARPLEEV